MLPLQLIVEDQPLADDLQFLEDHINAYNMARTGAYDARMLAIWLRNARQEIVAGLSGYTWAGFCEIQFVWVHAELRGQGYGTQLVQAAERAARARGCSLTVLSSYSFQAPNFYQRLGYQIAGRIADCPPGHAHYSLYKRLM